jgi:hypothetical protein
MRYLPVRADRLDLEGFARRGGVHPDLVRRFVALGLLDVDRDASGQLWLHPRELFTLARIERLRSGLALNYAAIGLVLDLLDQIDRLRADAQRPPRG